MATVTTPKITVAEFLEMDLGEGLHELVHGEIVKMPPPEYSHGYVCGNFYRILFAYGARTGHGHAATNDSRVEISDDTLRGADVSYYREERWPRSQIGKQPPPGPPDLIVEVISSGDRPGKVQEKVGDYLSAGVPMVWVAYPKTRKLVIYRGDDPIPSVLTDSDIVENLPELPGFRGPVAEFFD